MNDARFRPRSTPPVELGPVRSTEHSTPTRPIDEYLRELYGPDEAPRMLIEAEPMTGQNTAPKFPLTMWAWAAGTAAAAFIAVLLILG